MFCGLTLVTDSLYEVSPASPALVILPSPQHCSTPHGRTRLKLREVELIEITLDLNGPCLDEG